MKPLTIVCLFMLLLAPKLHAQTLTYMPVKQSFSFDNTSLAAFDNGVLVRTASAWLGDTVRAFLLRTTSDGQTWYNVDSANQLQLATFVKGHGNLYARDLNKTLWSSGDEGASWQHMPFPPEYDVTTDRDLFFVSDQFDHVVCYSEDAMWIIDTTPNVYSDPIAFLDSTMQAMVLIDGQILAMTSTGVLYWLDAAQQWKPIADFLRARGLAGYEVLLAGNRMLLYDQQHNAYLLENDTAVFLQKAKSINERRSFKYVDDFIMMSSYEFFLRSDPDSNMYILDLLPTGTPVNSVSFVAHSSTAQYWSFQGHVFKLVSTDPLRLEEKWYTQTPVTLPPFTAAYSCVMPNGTLVSSIGPNLKLGGVSVDGGYSWHAIDFNITVDPYHTLLNVDTEGTLYFKSDQCVTSTNNAQSFDSYTGEMCNSNLGRMVFHSGGSVSYSTEKKHFRAPQVGAPFTEIEALNGYSCVLFSTGVAITLDIKEYEGCSINLTSDDGQNWDVVNTLPILREGSSPNHYMYRLNDHEFALVRTSEVYGDTCDVWHYDLLTGRLRMVYTSSVFAIDVFREPGMPLFIATGSLSVLAINDDGTIAEYTDPFFGKLYRPSNSIGLYQFYYGDGKTYLIHASQTAMFRLGDIQNVTEVAYKGQSLSGAQRILYVSRNESFEIESFTIASGSAPTATITDVSGLSYAANIIVGSLAVELRAPAGTGMYFLTLCSGTECEQIVVFVH